MSNNKHRFIVRGNMGDGRPGWVGYGPEGFELFADRAKAKVYKIRLYAEIAADKFGAVVVQIDNDVTLSPGDMPAVVKALNTALRELRETSEGMRVNGFDWAMQHIPPQVRRYITVDQSPVYWDNNDYDPTLEDRNV